MVKVGKRIIIKANDDEEEDEVDTVDNLNLSQLLKLIQQLQKMKQPEVQPQIQPTPTQPQSNTKPKISDEKLNRVWDSLSKELLNNPLSSQMTVKDAIMQVENTPGAKKYILNKIKQIVESLF